jgi:rhodanese-related sulfurtransferase
MSESNLQYIDARQLKAWVHDDAELALLDVREHGQYGENHLFFAVPLPYSTLELEIGRLVPRKSARVVVYGDDASAGAVSASARILSGLGYTDVHVLEGGIEAWVQAGYSTFAGVNLPSKTFGELAEHAYGTPSISADELYKKLNDENENIVVLDGRPVNEYHKMNIPGAICCPNGELALRVGELVPDPKTTIVINCAGRTRSIIGAQTLINLDVPNKVYALENGTQGWYLADYPLEHKSSRVYPQAISEGSMAVLRERSAGLVR